MEDEFSRDLLPNDSPAIPKSLKPQLPKILFVAAVILLIPYILIIVLFVQVSKINDKGNDYNSVN